MKMWRPRNIISPGPLGLIESLNFVSVPSRNSPAESRENLKGIIKPFLFYFLTFIKTGTVHVEVTLLYLYLDRYKSVIEPVTSVGFLKYSIHFTYLCMILQIVYSLERFYCRVYFVNVVCDYRFTFPFRVIFVVFWYDWMLFLLFYFRIHS